MAISTMVAGAAVVAKKTLARCRMVRMVNLKSDKATGHTAARLHPGTKAEPSETEARYGVLGKRRPTQPELDRAGRSFVSPTQRVLV